MMCLVLLHTGDWLRSGFSQAATVNGLIHYSSILQHNNRGSQKLAYAPQSRRRGSTNRLMTVYTYSRYGGVLAGVMLNYSLHVYVRIFECL